MELKDIRFKDWSLSLREPGAVVEGLEDIAQCIAVIVVTQKGSDPFRPDFGVDLFKWIDSPVNVAGPNLVVEILEAIRKWEPRVSVERIEYRVEDARLYFSIIWTFNGTQGETTLLREGDAFVIPTLEPPVRQFVADPTFSPASGTFAGFGEISIECETEDAIIYYTLDGSVPTGASPVYTAPFIVNQDTIVRARAFRTGFIPSGVSSASYAIVAYEATILTSPGTYDGQVNVDIVANDPTVDIHYTLDGSEPTAASPIYSGTLTLVESATVKAKAIRAPGLSAPADSVSITIRSLAPSISPTSGTFETSRIVAMTNPNPAGSIYYTLDGSEPTSSSTLYSGPFIIEASRTVRARVISPLNIPSTISQSIITLIVANPLISPNGGFVASTDPITLSSATPGAEIRYTTNGTDPTSSSTLYTAPINLSTGTVQLRVRAFKTGLNSSAISSASFTIAPGEVGMYIAAEGITNPTIIDAVTNFVNNLVTDGIWAKLDVINLRLGTGRFNLRDPRDLDGAFRQQFFGTITMSANGATPNGSAHARTFYQIQRYNSQNGISYGVFVRNVSGAQQTFLGVNFSASNGNARNWRGSGGLQNQVPFIETDPFRGVEPAGNFMAASILRGGGTSSVIRAVNGAFDIGTNNLPVSANTFEFFSFARNNQGTADSFSTATEEMMFIGRYLTPTDVANLRTRYLAFRTAIGR